LAFLWRPNDFAHAWTFAQRPPSTLLMAVSVVEPRAMSNGGARGRVEGWAKSTPSEPAPRPGRDCHLWFPQNRGDSMESGAGAERRDCKPRHWKPISNRLNLVTPA